MDVKKIFWPAASILLILLIYFNTNTQMIFQTNIILFFMAAIFFLISTVFWAFAWAETQNIKYKQAFLINTKALMGIFSPMNIGGDALRAYFSKDRANALASSFVVKFFKFIIMALLMIVAILYVGYELQFPEYALSFISMLILSIAGAFMILACVNKKMIFFVQKFFKQDIVPAFREKLAFLFTNLDLKQIFKITVMLSISTFFEILSVFFVFESLDIQLKLITAFVISIIINSLALITITPQGIGFVEGGALFFFSFAMFDLSPAIIGSFLILWDIIRIWIPSLTGLVLFWCNK